MGRGQQAESLWLMAAATSHRGRDCLFWGPGRMDGRLDPMGMRSSGVYEGLKAPYKRGALCWHHSREQRWLLAV